MRRYLNTLYVQTEGAWLHKDGTNIVVEVEGAEKGRVPAHLLGGLVCVGRVDPTKGTDLLIRYFLEYKRRNPSSLALVLLGQVVNQPPQHDDVIAPGIVSDEVKWSALRGAAALVSPSVNESFSLVVLESWLAGTPVLVNAACGATVEHSRLSGGGLWFGGYAEFEVMVDRLVGEPGLGLALAAAGARYVDDRFRWPVLVRRYDAFLYLDQTRALRPLHDVRARADGEVPETFPSGV